MNQNTSQNLEFIPSRWRFFWLGFIFWPPMSIVWVAAVFALLWLAHSDISAEFKIGTIVIGIMIYWSLLILLTYRARIDHTIKITNDGVSGPSGNLYPIQWPWSAREQISFPFNYFDSNRTKRSLWLYWIFGTPRCLCSNDDRKIVLSPGFTNKQTTEIIRYISYARGFEASQLQEGS